VPLSPRCQRGGNQYTDALQKELDLSFEDAERLKKGDSLPSVTDEQSSKSAQRFGHIELESQKTFDFFRPRERREYSAHCGRAAQRASPAGDLLREDLPCQ